MRLTLKAILLALFVGALGAPLALAHSLEEVEQNLASKDKYLQLVDMPTPPFSLQDASGKTVTMSDLLGKVVVLNFIYTNCADFCPLHAEKIAEIQKLTNASAMKARVQFVTITTDPTRDRGEVLTEYGKSHGLDPVNWSFLTTAPEKPEDTTRLLARAYGLKFTETEDGEQMHGVVTHVIDQDGRLRARFHGLDFDSVNLVVFLNALTNRELAPHSEPGVWDWLKGMFG